MKPDLNRLSAEKIMGWVWSSEYEMWCDGQERDADGRITYANPNELDWINDDPDELGQQEPWTPLTDMNQCFQMVKKMEELGWWLYWNNEENDATFYGKRRQLTGQGCSSDPGGAILIAALKAVGALEE